MTTSRFIVDASPLIVLAKVGRLDLLERLADEYLIPARVAEEVLRGPDSDPARAFLTSAMPTVAEVVSEPTVLEWGLGLGETAVISAALQLQSIAVIDDRAARTCCKALGVKLTGTLGLVLRGTRTGLVRRPEDLLKDLRAAGFRISEATVADALERLGL